MKYYCLPHQILAFLENRQGHHSQCCQSVTVPVTVGFKASKDFAVLTKMVFGKLQLIYPWSDKKCQERRMIAVSFGHLLVHFNGLLEQLVWFGVDFGLNFHNIAVTVMWPAMSWQIQVPWSFHMSQKAKIWFGRLEYFRLSGNNIKTVFVPEEMKKVRGEK